MQGRHILEREEFIKKQAYQEGKLKPKNDRSDLCKNTSDSFK